MPEKNAQEEETLEHEEKLENKELEQEHEKVEGELKDTENKGEDEGEDEEGGTEDEQENEEEEYIVEKIVGMRKVGRKYEFKVHWLGFDDSQDTWEAEDFLQKESGEEVIQLVTDFKAKAMASRAKGKNTRASRNRNWEYVTIDDDDDTEIPKRDRELGPDDDFFGEKVAEAKGEKKKLYDPSHKTSKTELFLAKVGTAERVTRQGIKKLMKGGEESSAGSSHEGQDKSRSTTPLAPTASVASSSFATSSSDLASTSGNTELPPRRNGRRNVLSSRGRALAESRRGASTSTRRVNPVSDIGGDQGPAASVPSRIPKKREADDTLDGEKRQEEAAEDQNSSTTATIQENSAPSKKSTESGNSSVPPVPNGSQKKKIIILDSFSLPRREGVMEKERPLPAPQENHMQKNHIPPERREVYEPPRREPFADMPNSDDDDWGTEDSKKKTTELRGTEIVTVDFDQEHNITWARETAPPTFRSITDIIRSRDPHRFEEAIVSDRYKQLGDILMQKDLNGSNVLHQICAASCDNQTHFADDLIALILRTVRNRRTILRETNALGLTPLHLAVKNGIMCLVKTLLKHKAPLAATDLNGCMPIHLAYENNHAKMVDTLLLAGSSYDQLFCNERRAPRKRRAFAQLQKHALKMHSLLQLSRQKTYARFEEVETVSPVFTLQSGEKEGQFDFRYRAKHLDGNHAYMVFFFVCDIQKENRDEWTARCWNSPSAFPLRFKQGFPRFNEGPMYPAQQNPDPLSYYCIFGKTEDNRISVHLYERCPLLVCCQVVLVKVFEPDTRPIFEAPDPTTALEYAPLVGPL